MRTTTLLLCASAWLSGCGPRKDPAAALPEAPPPNPCPAGGAVSNTIGSPTSPEFDRDTAMRAMSSIDVSACAKKEKGATGCAQVQLQIEPTGNVSSASACETTLSSAVRACIEKRFKALSVPPFRDRAVLTRAKVCVGGAK